MLSPWVGFNLDRLLYTFIDREPVVTQMSYGFFKFVKADGFPHIAVGSEGVASCDVLSLIGGGQHDHGNQGMTVARPDLLEKFQPIHLWDLQIEQDQGREAPGSLPMGREKLEGFLPIPFDLHVIVDATFLEGHECQCLVVGVVLDQ